MLTTLYPALLKFAESELRTRGLNDQEAQDIVQAAWERWLRTTDSYLRDAIRGLVANLTREGADAMSHDPISIDRYPDQIEEL